MPQYSPDWAQWVLQNYGWNPDAAYDMAHETPAIMEGPISPQPQFPWLQATGGHEYPSQHMVGVVPDPIAWLSMAGTADSQETMAHEYRHAWEDQHSVNGKWMTASDRNALGAAMAALAQQNNAAGYAARLSQGMLQDDPTHANQNLIEALNYHYEDLPEDYRQKWFGFADDAAAPTASFPHPGEGANVYLKWVTHLLTDNATPPPFMWQHDTAEHP